MKRSLFNIKQEAESNAPSPGISTEKLSKSDIAIIGMSGKLPMADDLDQFWQNLKMGKDCITPFPEQRAADIKEWLAYNQHDTQEIAFKEKGYLQEIDQFDYKFFKISPKEASLMNPAQRLFLQSAWLALEEAGYAGKAIRGTKTGVYVGYTERRSFYHNMVFDVEPQSATLAYPGNIASIIASRISYLLDLKGPSLLIDTACSSSLVAVHLACQSIRNGECDMAIAGGVNIHWLPTKSQGQGIGIESMSGRARTFDDSSDGTIGGEGCVAIFLKPLSKALRDGDHIHAVIKGSAMNQDGSSIGITAPSVLAQEEVITKAWKNAHIDPETLSYIEAHGTATELGDPIEVDGLTRAFRKFTTKKQFCAVGSVKTNCGHLDATAGITGLVKAALSLKNKQLPPHLHFEKPNGKINFEESPLFVNDSLYPWDTDAATPRRCGVSSFGISGTNCHLVLEEAPATEPTGHSAGPYLLTLSAKSEAALKQLIVSYRNFARQNKSLNLADVCYTAAIGREHHAYRLALVLNDSEDFRQKISRLSETGLDGLAAKEVYYHHTKVVPASRSEIQNGECTQAQLDKLSGKLNAKMDGTAPFSEGLFAELGAGYVQGASIAWEKVYGGQPGKRCSLPVYPLEEKRCWISYPALEPVAESNPELVSTEQKSGLEPQTQAVITPQPEVSAARETKSVSTARLPSQQERLKRLIDMQLQVMADQLALLSQVKGGSVSDSATPAEDPAPVANHQPVDAVPSDETHEQPTYPPQPSTHSDLPQMTLAQAEIPAVSLPVGTERPEVVAAPSEPAMVYPSYVLADAETIPLTDEQQRLWMLSSLSEQASASFNLSQILPVFSKVDPNAMHRAVNRLVERHQSLRVLKIDDAFQYVASELQVDIPFLSFQGKPEQALEEWIAAEKRRPFDLSRGPLFRAHVLYISDEQFIFVLVIHHLIADGWSMGIVIRELTALYLAECESTPISLPQPTPYREYVAWLTSQCASEQGRASEQFWLQEFSRPLSRLIQPPAGALRGGGSFRLRLHRELTRRLKVTSQQQGSSLFMSLLAMYQVLLYRLNGQGHQVTGIPSAGQLSMEKSCLVGHCVQMLPFQVELESGMSLQSVIKRVKAKWLLVSQHQVFSLSKVLESPVYWPDLPMIFNLDAKKDDSWQEALTEAYEITEQALDTPKYNLFVSGQEVKQELCLTFQYNTSFMPPSEMQGWVENFARLLEQWVADPTLLLGEVQLDVADSSLLKVTPTSNDIQAEKDEPDTSDPVEAELLLLYKNILGIGNLRPSDHFFQLGGNSLRAIQLLSRIFKSFGVKLTLPALFERGSVSGLAALIRSSDKQVYQSLQPLPAQDDYEVSHAQKRLWILSQVEEDFVAYHMSSAYVFKGDFDREAFERALHTVIQRHESLRTGIITVNGAPRQKVYAAEDLDFQVAYLDLRGQTDRDERARQLVSEEKKQAFNLAAAPLIRAKLIHVEENEYTFLFTMHHIISDGWSKEILVEEVSALYDAYRQGKANPLSPLRIQYKDYVAWQNQQLGTDSQLPAQQYWLEKYRGELPVLALPLDFPRPPLRSHRGAIVTAELSKETLTFLKELSRQKEATLFMTLLASIKALMYRYTRQEDMIIGSPFAGRDHVDLENLIGFFVTTLSFRTQFKGNESFENLLLHVKESVLGVYQHQHYPVDRLIEDLDLKRDLSRSPLFDVMINLISAYRGEMSADQSDAMAGMTVDHLPTENTSNKFDLMFTFHDFEEGMSIELNYNTDLFTQTRMERLLAHYQQLLAAIQADCTVTLDALDYLTPAEKDQLGAANQLSIPYPGNETIIEAFERQAEKNPDAIALVCEERQLTYRELNEQANQWAHYFRSQHAIQPEDRIGLLVQRSEKQIVGLLAILKAGAAYLPIDPEYPADRIAYMLRDSGIRVLLADEVSVPEIGLDFPGTVLVETVAEEVASLPLSNPVRVALPHHLAYVIYTSGSTGKPKGVMIEHAALLDYVSTFTQYFSLSADDVVIQQASLSFDTAVEEIYPALCAGARLVVLPEGGRNIAEMFRTIENTRATLLSTSPLVLNELNREAERLNSLRVLISGGDALKSGHISQLINRVPVYNTYGPAESTVCVSFHPVKSLDDTAVIGKPISNRRIYILDESLQMLPVGVPGQLCLGGAGLARGYWNQPQLNQEKFIDHLFEPGQRLYLTGDLGQWLEDGSIQFLGRSDSQIKIRGNRVETGEVEAALKAYPGIREAMVLAKEDGEGVKYLVAYYISSELLPVTDCRTFLGTQLPEYMIPGYFVRVEQWPVTAHGKTDLKALAMSGTEIRGECVGPRNQTEAVLVQIWQEVLVKEKIGILDNFFEVGGHSLKATRVLLRIHQELGSQVSLRDIFRHPTIDGLSQVIATAEKKAYEGITPISPQDAYEVSHAQKRLWILDQMEEGLIAYNMPVAYEFEGALDTPALEKAFQTLLTRHESLRTTFVMVNGELKQRFNEVDFSISQLDLRQEADSEVTARSLVKAEASIPFDLGKGPLIRASLLRLTEEKYVFVYTIHHIVADGWSLQVLANEILALYDAYRQDLPNPLSPLRIQYKDYVAWQKQLFGGHARHDSRQYWLQQFSGEVPVLALAADFPRPALKTQHGANTTAFIEPDLTAALKALAKKHDATLFITLLAAVNALLYKYTEQQDIVIGSPVAGRDHSDLADQIGFYANTLALRTQFDASRGFDDLMGKVKETVMGAFENQAYPFDQLVEELEVVRDLSRSPLFDVMVVLLNTEAESKGASDMEGVEVSTYASGMQMSKYDLTFNFRETGDGLLVNLNYNTDLFEEDSTVIMLEKLKRLLDVACAPDCLPLRDYQLTLNLDEPTGEINNTLEFNF